MAGKKNNRNSSRRKTQKQKIGTGGSPIPPRYVSRLSYLGIGTINAASSLVGSTGYRLNGMFDPDFSGTGIQPLYYDQMSALYSKYRVYRAIVTLDISNETEETTTVFAFPSIANSAGTSLAAMCTQRYSKAYTLGPKSGGQGMKRVTMQVDIAKVWGVDQRTLRSEDDFAAATSGNPGNTIYLWIGGRCIGTTATILRYTLRIVYECDFHMPLIQEPS